MKRNTKQYLMSIVCVILIALTVCQLSGCGKKKETVDENTTTTSGATNDAVTVTQTTIQEKTSKKSNRLTSVKGNFVEPTKEDWKNLGTDKDNFDSVLYPWLHYLGDTKEYNSNDLTAKDVLQKLTNWTGYCDTYKLYFDEPEKIEYNKQPDPMKQYARNEKDTEYFSGFYYKYPAKNINWMLENIYNVKPKTIKNFDRGVFGASLPYYYEDYYYFNAPNGGDGYTPSRVNPDNYVKLDDGRYKVSIDFVGGYEENPYYEKYAEMVVGLKQIDGKRFWSLYEYKNFNE